MAEPAFPNGNWYDGECQTHRAEPSSLGLLHRTKSLQQMAADAMIISNPAALRQYNDRCKEVGGRVAPSLGVPPPV